MNSQISQPNSDEVSQATVLESIRTLARGFIVELRALNVPDRPGGYRATHLGWFAPNTYVQAARHAVELDTRGASGVYLTLNPVNPALSARANGRVKQASKETPATGDADIAQRQWLPLDFDPVRPTGISATDEEKALAFELADAVALWLSEQGWPDPVIADSGNGAHLLYLVDLPADTGARDLVRDCLAALALRFDTPQVKIDRTTFNASRIWKLYGTHARKGDSTSDRPHRVSAVLSVPAGLVAVPLPLLGALARMLPAKPDPVAAPARRSGGLGHATRGAFDVAQWLPAHGLEVLRADDTPDGTRFILRSCPFVPEHEDSSVFRLSSGGLSFHCFHNTCQGRTWQDVRDLLEPDRPRGGSAAPPAAGAGPAPVADADDGDGPAADPGDTQGNAPGRATLLKTQAGPRKCLENMIRILTQDERWQGVLAWDEFAQRTVATRPAPHATGHTGEWTDDDDRQTAAWMALEYDYHTSGALVAEATAVVAARTVINPLRDRLDALAWDGTPRIDTWLTECLGVDPAEKPRYVQAVGAAYLISAVARVYAPGCKVDHLLILEGQQGAGKSLAMRELAFGDAWFSDEVPKFEHKDAPLSLAGKWIVEFSELQAFTRSEVEVVKAFVSRAVDRYREPYGRRTVDFPRRCVFVGTTNGSEYLRDESGNRRFWPIRVGRIDLDRIRRERDLIWAEAVARYRAGETWWLSQDLELEAAEEQDSRYAYDEWEGRIHDHIRDTTETSVPEILEYCFSIRPQDFDQARQNRVVRALKRLGWVRRQIRKGPKRVWKYVPDPKKAPKTEDGPGHPAETGDTKNLSPVTSAPGNILNFPEKTPPCHQSESQAVTDRGQFNPLVANALPTVSTVTTNNNKEINSKGYGGSGGTYIGVIGNGCDTVTLGTTLPVPPVAPRAEFDTLTPEEDAEMRRGL